MMQKLEAKTADLHATKIEHVNGVDVFKNQPAYPGNYQVEQNLHYRTNAKNYEYSK